MSNVNQAEQTLENRLINEVAALKREINALKTRQLNGSDNLVYEWSSEAEASFTVDAGDALTLSATLTSLVPNTSPFPLLFWNVYIDNDHPDQRWPNGSGLTPDQKTDIRVLWFYDLYSTPESAMSINAKIQIYNGYSFDLDFIFKGRWRLPRLTT